MHWNPHITRRVPWGGWLRRTDGGRDEEPHDRRACAMPRRKYRAIDAGREYGGARLCAGLPVHRMDQDELIGPCSRVVAASVRLTNGHQIRPPGSRRSARNIGQTNASARPTTAPGSHASMMPSTICIAPGNDGSAPIACGSTA
jgi:hypothetical protein